MDGERRLTIGFLLVQIARAQRIRLETALREIGLHVGQEHAIYQLAHRDGVAQTTLAHSLFIDVSTATKMLLRLERAGLIERRPDPDDGRVVRVYLTQEGRTVVAPVITIWNTVESQLVEGLTDTEQALLRRLLVQVRENIA